MAQRTRTHWDAIGRDALLDLVTSRLVITPFEARSRISAHGWHDFPLVQPIPLHNARRSLVASGHIIEERSSHDSPVVTLRVPTPPRGKRRIERLLGSRRKLYRKYLSWTNNEALCGKHAEHVVHQSLVASSPEAIIWVPPQTPGQIDEIHGFPVQPGPLDAFALILDYPGLGSEVTMAVEVKNINDWIHPWTPELWELLLKAARLAVDSKILPVLVCMRAHYSAFQMAKDIGFFVVQTNDQLFSLDIPNADFQEVVAEFDLTIARHAGPLDAINSFLRGPLRRSPPPTPPEGESVPWYKRQADRFQTIAPAILRFEALAESLDVDARKATFAAFTTAAHAAMTWPPVRGW